MYNLQEKIDVLNQSRSTIILKMKRKKIKVTFAIEKIIKIRDEELEYFQNKCC